MYLGIASFFPCATSSVAVSFCAIRKDLLGHIFEVQENYGLLIVLFMCKVDI